VELARNHLEIVWNYHGMILEPPGNYLKLLRNYRGCVV
jgi:hypothetical protein